MAAKISRRKSHALTAQRAYFFYAALRINLHYFLATLTKCKNAARPVK